MENLVKLTIDGVSVEVPAGTTVLEAAKKAGINIPTLMKYIFFVSIVSMINV